jgi:hypothetical protein
MASNISSIYKKYYSFHFNHLLFKINSRIFFYCGKLLYYEKMFYEEEKISSVLHCPNCEKIFKDPRLLPCENTICQGCVDEMRTVNANEVLKCKICEQVHVIPDGGFLKNNVVNELLGLQPKELYRGKAYENLRTKLEQISSELNELEESLNNSQYKIKEHCDYLRNDIQVATESAIDLINQHSKELLEQVDKYEKTCRENFISNEKVTSSMSTFLDENKKFHSEWNDYMKKSDIDEEKLNSACKTAEENLDKLGLKRSLFKGLLFFGDSLCFEPSNQLNDSKSLGKLTQEKMFNIYHRPKEVDLNCMVIKNKHSDFFIDYCYKTHQLDMIELVHPHKNSLNYSTYLMDTREIRNKEIRLIDKCDIKFSSSSQYRFLCFYNEKMNVLGVYDKSSFNRLTKYEFHGHVQCLSSNDSHVFILTDKALLRLDFDLNLIDEKECIRNDVVQMKVDNAGKVYLLSSTCIFQVYEYEKLNLISKLDLKAKESNECSFGSFALSYANKFVNFMDENKRQMNFYSIYRNNLLDKVDMDEIGLEALSNKSKIIQHVNYKDNFLLFDQTSLKLHIF